MTEKNNRYRVEWNENDSDKPREFFWQELGDFNNLGDAEKCLQEASLNPESIGCAGKLKYCSMKKVKGDRIFTFFCGTDSEKEIGQGIVGHYTHLRIRPPKGSPENQRYEIRKSALRLALKSAAILGLVGLILLQGNAEKTRKEREHAEFNALYTNVELVNNYLNQIAVSEEYGQELLDSLKIDYRLKEGERVKLDVTQTGAYVLIEGNRNDEIRLRKEFVDRGSLEDYVIMHNLRENKGNLIDNKPK